MVGTSQWRKIAELPAPKVALQSIADLPVVDPASILEETGIRTGAVTYYATQPWPFPSSLMIGCFVEALSREIVLDTKELADALLKGER